MNCPHNVNAHLNELGLDSIKSLDSFNFNQSCRLTIQAFGMMPSLEAMTIDTNEDRSELQTKMEIQVVDQKLTFSRIEAKI